jgi:hypothetical protein
MNVLLFVCSWTRRRNIECTSGELQDQADVKCILLQYCQGLPSTYKILFFIAGILLLVGLFTIELTTEGLEIKFFIAGILL